MSKTDQTIALMAGAIMKLQAQVQAQDALMRALFTERAITRETFPQEAEEEILGVAESVGQGPRAGFEGEDRHLADVQSAIRTFATALRQDLEERRQTV